MTDSPSAQPEAPCPACRAKGYYAGVLGMIDPDCPYCKGRGKLPVDEAAELERRLKTSRPEGDVLLPCPRCRTPPVTEHISGNALHIYCNTEGCPHQAFGKTAARAVEVWNTLAAPPQPAPDAMREALEARKTIILGQAEHHGWRPGTPAWERAFGELAGINFALGLSAPVPPASGRPTSAVDGHPMDFKEQVKKCEHELGFLAIVAELNGDDEMRRAANRAWHQLSDARAQPEKR